MRLFMRNVNANGLVYGFQDIGDLSTFQGSFASDESYFTLGNNAYYTHSSWTALEIADVVAEAHVHSGVGAAGGYSAAVLGQTAGQQLQLGTQWLPDVPMPKCVPVKDRKCRKCKNQSLRQAQHPDGHTAVYCRLCGDETPV